MRQIVKFDQTRRVWAMVLAIIMVMSIVPLGVLATSPSELSTDIGEKDFIVGQATEFTFTTTANDDAGKMVKGSFVFSDPAAIEKLEYKESKDGNWYEFYGDFGPATGFPMIDGTSEFRVTFKKVGIYSVEARMVTVEDGAVLCSVNAAVTVNGRSTLTTDIDDKTFVVGEALEFSFTTMANEDAGRFVLGSFVFSDTEAVEKLEYKESQDGNWYEFYGDFGPATGFPITDDATSYFRATFKEAGVYTLTSYMKEVATGDTLCFNVATVTVKQRSPISFEEESVEIKYTDVNAINDTLIDNVVGGEYTYVSEDEDIVKVDENGILTPVSVGETTVTVTRAENVDYVEASASYTVTVIPGDQDALVWENTVPESIKWNAPEGYINTVTGGTGDGEVTYVSNNTEVADVDLATGELTLKKPGIVTITAIKDGGELYEDKSASYVLAVIKSEQAALVFDQSNPDAICYGETCTNAASGGSSSASIRYNSSDDSVATVDESGVVTPLKYGVVTITATLAGDDYYEDAAPITYTLTINRAVQGTELVFEKGVTGQSVKYGIEYTNAASGGDTSPITYSSSDETIAKVDENGSVTTFKAGVVTITATVPQSDQYLEQKLSYELTVELAPQVVDFENGITNIPAITYGGTYQNVAYAITAISYSSSDDTIAEVDGDGNLIVHKSGTVTITATAAESEQYAEASSSYTITINKAEQTISFEKGEVVEVIFNDNQNNFSNIASSNATTGDEDDRKDIVVTYSIESGAEFIDAASFDSATGEFVIIGAGTIVVKASFSTNERYNENTAYYTLTVKKDEQTIAFSDDTFEMINGDNNFSAPVASEQGDKYGTGRIVYSIDKNDDGVVSAIDFETGELTFTNELGSVTILATKLADDNYNETTTKYTLDVNEWQTDGQIYYSLNGATINDSGWFTGNVSIDANEGYLLSYEKVVGEADWQESLADAVTKDGIHVKTFYIKNVANGQISNLQTVEIRKDTVNPEAAINHEKLSGWDNFLSIITLGIWEPAQMNFTVENNDATSKVEKVEYYVAEGTTDVIDTAAMDAITDWEEYSESIKVDSNKIFVVYAKVTDTAGHYTYANTNGIVFDKTPVSEDDIVINILTEDSEGFYDEDVELEIQIDDALPSSGINNISYEILNNGVQTQSGTLLQFDIENPTYAQLVPSWNSADNDKNIIVDSEKNNSDFVVVKITVTDNAGNTTTKELPLKICINKPVIDVTYVDDPEAIEIYEGVTYYNACRTAKIVITGRTSVFRASVAPAFVISESKGNTPDRVTYEVIGWTTNEVEGNPDAATQTYIIKFNGSANYEFSVDYTDIFGNNLNHASNKFVVDLEKPTGSVTIDETNTWTRLLETLTFGLWKNSEVTIKATAADITSPIKSVEYIKENLDRILTTTELAGKTWNTFEEFKVSSDEQFNVYLKITDRAGHIEYISSDGYIVDMENSNIVIVPESPNENNFYNDDVTVAISVEDTAPYSGIKTVEYWVECDGVETIRRTLYSYEYTRASGDNSNGGHLVIKELDSNGQLVTAFDQNGYVPSKSDLKSSFAKTIIVDAHANNSDNVLVFVRVVDNAGNEMVEQIEQPLRIDVVPPEIDVSFDVNNGNMVDDRGYFRNNRVATIVFTERTSGFNRDKATDGIVITGKDSNGQSVVLDRASMITWGETVEAAGNPDGATHTAYCYFNVDANYEFTLSYTDQAGNPCEYENVRFASETVAPRYFTVDKIAPVATVSVADQTWDRLIDVLTFGIFKKESVTVNASATDATSPVTIEYYKTNATSRLDASALDTVKASDWTLFAPIEIPTDERFVVYLRATDSAGNYIYISTNGHIIDMTSADITLTPEPTEMYHEKTPLYNKDVNVLIDIKEQLADTYSGIKEVEYWVKCDGKETQREILFSFDKSDPAFIDLVNSFAKTVVIKAEENNSCDVVLYVGVTDNAGNYIEKNVAVDIDISAPEIKVIYDNNDAYKVIEDKGYFPETRTATVVITERSTHFDAKKATEGIKITAVDVSGKTVIEDCSALISEWKAAGSGNETTYTATIDYLADANYTFEISYTDLAENSNDGVDTGNSVSPYAFAVDTAAPTGTVTAGDLGTWNKLVEVLTFGMWSQENVKVTGTADDVTTPIESVTYYKTADTTLKTVAQLDAVTEWAEFSELVIPKDERFVIYVKIVDFAGNTTYISTNGIIIDDTDPVIEHVKPEITITPEPTHGIYNSDVTFAVSVVDPKVGGTDAYSGLKEIRYEVYNLGELTEQGILYSFDVANPEHKELIQSWSSNNAIVVDAKANNSNDVKVVVYALDNAGNSNRAECDVDIDITNPEISVQYNNNSADTSFSDRVYFRENRTGTITVTERNFDPDMVSLVITNTDGYIPRISAWTTVAGTGNGDDTTHTAYVVFDRDGDYTFSISCTDTAENENLVLTYGQSLAPTSFTIDKTAPSVSVVYDNNNAVNGNYYNAQRVATITVTEHNFETSRIRITLGATDDGAQAPLPTVSQWSSIGNVHTATVTYFADARYAFDFDYRDKAGNATSDIAEQVFYIDTTAPVLGIENIVDESANNDEGDIGFVMTATDTNFDVFEPTVIAVVKNGNAFETKILDNGEFTDIKNGKVFTVSNIEADGIYRITCTLVDKAGNEYSEVILENADGIKAPISRAGGDTLVTFSVNRNGSTFEIDENTADIVEKYYIQNVNDDVVIVEINADPLMEYTVSLNDKALENGKDYTVDENGGNGSWMKYTYKVKKDLFADEGEYKLVVSSKDKAENNAFSDIKSATVEFVVDRTAPVVTVSGLATDGRYQTEKQTVTLIPTDDGGALNTLIVNLLDEDDNVVKEVVNLSGEILMAKLEENGGMITFEIDEGLYQNVQIICTDCAIGDAEAINVYDSTIKNVSVSSSVFMIFWANKPARWGTIGGVGAVAVAAAGFLTLRRRRRAA